MWRRGDRQGRRDAGVRGRHVGVVVSAGGARAPRGARGCWSVRSMTAQHERRCWTRCGCGSRRAARSRPRPGWRRRCGPRGRLLGDAEVLGAAGQLRSELVGTGPLEPLLADPTVTDVLVTAPDRVWVDRGGGLERTGVALRGRGGGAQARPAARRGGRAAAGRRPAVGGRPAAGRHPAARRAAARSPSARPACRCGWCGRGPSRWRSWSRRGRCRRAATGCCGLWSTPGCPS